MPAGKLVRISVNKKDYGWWRLPASPETLSVQDQMQVELSPEGVRAVSSRCPRQICVGQGKISLAGESIVCVPNKIVITLESDSVEVDGVVQ
jgi:hypothetical protein